MQSNHDHSYHLISWAHIGYMSNGSYNLFQYIYIYIYDNLLAPIFLSYPALTQSLFPHCLPQVRHLPLPDTSDHCPFSSPVTSLFPNPSSPPSPPTRHLPLPCGLPLPHTPVANPFPFPSPIAYLSLVPHRLLLPQSLSPQVPMPTPPPLWPPTSLPLLS